MKKILLTFVICFSVFSGDEFFCHKLQQGRCHNPNPISSYVTQLNWIENKIATENQLIRQEQKRLAARIRFLRFDKDHMDKEWIQQEYETIKFYFKVLVEINKMIEQTNKKITIIKDAASQRVELQDDLHELNKLKVNILVTYPALRGENIEKLALKYNVDESDILSEKITRMLNNGETGDKLKEEVEKLNQATIKAQAFGDDDGVGELDFMNALRDDSEELHKYLDYRTSTNAKIKNAFIKEDFTNPLLINFYNSLDHEQEILNAENPKQLCYTFNVIKKKAEKYALEKAVVDGVVLMASLFLPPFARAALTPLKSVRLMNWGLRSKIFNTETLTTLTSSLYFAGDSMREIKELNDQCQRLHNDITIYNEVESYQSLKTCEKARLGRYVQLFTSGTLAISTLPKSISTLRGIQESINARGRYVLTRNEDEFFNHLAKLGLSKDTNIEDGIKFSGKGFDMLALNLRHANRNEDFKDVADRYWEHVANVYNQRKILPREKVAAFIESSKNMEDRTLLIAKQLKEASEEGEKFSGGVGLVFSKGAGEKLPLEKALGKSLVREGKSVEIVRLTADTKNNDYQDLIYSIVQIAKSDPEIKNFYVYTSKRHARRYQRGFRNHKIVLEEGEDRVIHISRDAFIEGGALLR